MEKHWFVLGVRILGWGFLMAGVGAMGLVSCSSSKIPGKKLSGPTVPQDGRALGGRVAIVYSRDYSIDLGGMEKLHPFDIHKYSRIYRKLVSDGLLTEGDVFVPHAVTEEQILLVHTPQFLESLNRSGTVARYLEAPVVAKVPRKVVDAGILSAFRSAAGGTISAGRQALRCGIAINLAGGYHHAKPHAGEGFNVYADLAITVRVLQREGLIKRAAIVDLDVHQGNGTAVIFTGDDTVFTFSMHQREIYPIPKETSDLDVELSAGTGDEEYLRILRKHLPRVLTHPRPDIVLLQGGCDTLDGDPLAGLKMTPEGIVERDAVVIDECVRRQIPVVMTLGGGYSHRAWFAQYMSIRRTIRRYGGR